ncbi:Transcriptional regulatory protein RcsB [Paraburkholderia aspalathi]|uniref:response regulator transcription factor n=1 Tax=Paraburkholderia aspalathi TaxID=1324617 RepID=UPI00190C76AC|nr:response regulator transcription factor [Paraburkholderia aspalathi]MBK3844345.1 response regulator transcription factor [Paraburkholderia aspalathi]CAE6871308.1 Transcriptional regulatory protein RcsB [Paraburkholderia aspalathi]
MKTVSIADDHPIAIHAVSSLVSGVPDFVVVHQCLGGMDLLKKLREEPTDVVVTDFSMGRGDHSTDGFVLLRKIRECAPDSGIVLFTAQKNPNILQRALRQSVNAVVSKEDELSEVIQACLLVNRGEGQYCSPIVKVLMEQADNGSGQRNEVLTRKELDVLRLYATGHSLVQIADQLGRTVSTISTQKHTAMKKLRLASNTELIRYAFETSLI